MATTCDINTLEEMAADFSISLDDAASARLLEFLDLMLAKNEVLNLTAIRDRDKGIVLHLLDSLLFMKGAGADDAGVLQFKGSFVDMVCGGGFPGIPLALANPDLKGLLCDSVKKKVAAVDEFIDKLELGDRLSTSSERLEILPQVYGEKFDYAFARALAPLPVLIEYASPLLKRDGRLIVSKGVPDHEELRSGQQAAKLAGMQRIETMELELPGDYGRRTLLVYGKMGKPSVRLPRAVGYALKHPLA